MPPIEVPMMRSGCSAAQRLRKSVTASSGSIGRSGATTLACGNTSRMRVTVPDCPDEAKPCT